VVTGDELDLLQAGERRDTDRLTVNGGRPRIVFYPDASGPPGSVPVPGADTITTPWDIVADRLFIQGESYLVASGTVEARRDSVQAFPETLEFDDLNERLLLRTDARMLTGSYEMEGDSIFGHVVDADIRSLTAFQHAILVGEDLRIAAPRIVVERQSGAVERLVASVLPTAPAGPPGLEEPAGAETDSVSIFDLEHPPRPVARAESFLMVADSIDVHAPAEVLERLVAVGRAHGESTARDSLNNDSTPELVRRDWIDGDTIIAIFGREESVPGAESGYPQPSTSGPPADSARSEYRLEELIARVDARSLYRLSPADSTEALAGDGTSVRLAVHYVTGREIRIGLDDGEIQVMEVVGPTQGFHLEPVGGIAAALDTLGDTTALPDTSGVLDSAAPDTAAPDTASSAGGVGAADGGAWVGGSYSRAAEARRGARQPPFRGSPPFLGAPSSDRGGR
jgi:hypothetical protein